jgi:tRNA (guanine37-N1)-methyltransferase
LTKELSVIEFHIVTLFPELFDGFISTSLIGKACEKETLSLNLINLRDYTHDRHNTVDDTPYGGGAGMVMKPTPIMEMLDDLPPSHRILLTPQGHRFDQQAADRLSKLSSITLFCGRYEGVDERVREEFDEELSLGDFVLNGGEVASMVVVEAVFRLIPGMLGNSESAKEESFRAGLLEYPQYTRPEFVENKGVPKVLLSGDHGRIAMWRRGQAILRTRQRRPDVFAKLKLTEEDERLLKEAEVEKEEQ